MIWAWGWWVSADPQVWSTAVSPMRAPRCLGSAAIVIILTSRPSGFDLPNVAGHASDTATKPAVTLPLFRDTISLEMAETTAGKQRGRPFRRGESGNSAGRPVGARHK